MFIYLKKAYDFHSWIYGVWLCLLCCRRALLVSTKSIPIYAEVLAIISIQSQATVDRDIHILFRSSSLNMSDCSQRISN